MEKTKDIYDLAVEGLTALPEEEFRKVVQRAWLAPSSHKYGCLFKYTGDLDTGCLTQVKSEYGEAPTPELTAKIRADPRLPSHPEDITKESLPAFAEWQKLLHPVS